jgi:DNA-binding NarL/FixJ family response regulator
VITIAIIEDNRLVREGITDMLRALPDFEVVLSGPSTDAASLRDSAPDVVLLDVGLQDADCLKIAGIVSRELPASRVVVMDLLPVDEEIAQLVHAGVAGFILKDATLEDFTGTIRSVAAGDRVLPQRMTATLFSQIAEAAVRRDRSQALAAVHMTPRELDVISLIAQGLGNREIAERLGIATDTVKSHVRNVMEKLALHTRLQIAAYAHQQND